MRLLKSIALFIALLAVVLVAPILMPGSLAPPLEPSRIAPPWQIEALPAGGSRAFGIVFGESSLDSLKSAFGGEDAVIALVVAPGESGAVEAYFERFDAGGIGGRLILNLYSSAAEREAMVQRAVKADFMDSTTRRITLADIDLAAMRRVPVTGASFIPAANLDEAIIQQRFGAPVERIRSSAQTEHFLYPERGLEIRLDAKGKEVLQYVAPRDFARLRDPLLKLPAS